MLRIGTDFPKITLTNIENKTITIPDDIDTKFCILLFLGVLGDQNVLFRERYRKYLVLFEQLGASIIAASFDSLEDTKLITEGKCFPNSGNRCRSHFVTELHLK